MSAGLPVVTTAVGGLVEAVRDYPGALQVPPRDPVALREALLQLPEHRGRRYADPHSWSHTAQSYYSLINEIHLRDSTGATEVHQQLGRVMTPEGWMRAALDPKSSRRAKENQRRRAA
jgi:hypothetical protein